MVGQNSLSGSWERSKIVNAVIPKEVLEEIKATVSKGIISVTGSETFNDKIIKGGDCIRCKLDNDSW